MTIELNNIGPQHAAPQRRELAGAAAASPFAALLAPADAADDRVKETPERVARQAAQQLVSSALLLPLLAQARQDPFKSDLFHGGQGEDMFGAQLDTILADRIASRTDMPLIGAIERSILGRRAGQVTADAGGRVNLHG